MDEQRIERLGAAASIRPAATRSIAGQSRPDAKRRRLIGGAKSLKGVVRSKRARHALRLAEPNTGQGGKRLAKG
jgi:hypothetical protein